MGNELDVKDINVDKDEGSECEGDAEVQLATGTYNESLSKFPKTDTKRKKPTVWF